MAREGEGHCVSKYSSYMPANLLSLPAPSLVSVILSEIRCK